MTIKPLLIGFIFSAMLTSVCIAENFYEPPIFQRSVLKTGENTGLMIEDQDGIIWLGTNGHGLFRYDGVTLKTYKTGPNSISDNYIFALYEDSEGLIWIGTRNGLNKYDKQTNPFTVYQHDPNNDKSISHDTFAWGSRSIWEDSSGDIWVGTMKGLNRFNKKDNRFERYFHDPDNPDSLGHDVIYAGIEDKDGDIWVATFGGGLNLFDRKAKTFTRFVHDPKEETSLSDDKLMSIIEDTDGGIWIGTLAGGLNKLNKENRSFSRFMHDPDNPDTISHNNVLSIFEDTKGFLWFGRYDVTPFGLEVFDRKQERFQVFHHDPDDPNSLSSDLIFGMMEDRAGTLWVANLVEDIDTIDKAKPQFKVFQHKSNDPSSLSTNSVVRVMEDNNKNIWVSPFGKGLGRLDPDSGRFVNYLPAHNQPLGMARYVPGIYEDSKGTFWLGNFGGSLSVFDRNLGKVVKTYQHDPDDPKSLVKHSQLNHIVEDIKDSNLLWLGAYDGGLVRFDKQSETFTQFNLSSNQMWMIHQDENGYIWIPTLGQGLDRFDPATRTVTNYRSLPNDPTTVSSNSLNFVYEDVLRNILWIGGTAGLDKFDKQTGKVIKQYTKRTGFNIGGVMTLIADDQGTLWMGTDSGLVKFNPDKESVSLYHQGDGLPSNRFNFIGVAKGWDGRLWFGTYGGLVSFYPEKIKDNTYVPPIILTALKQGGEPLIPDRAPEKIKEVTLDWRLNFFEFEYTALNYTQPDKCQFKYLLEGFDPDWFNAGNKRFGRYTNLPGGTYRLKIKGSNNDGVWNEEGICINIIVTQPFWKAGWFYLVIVGGILMVFAFTVFNLLKLKKEVRHRQQAQAELATHHERFLAILDGMDATIYVSDFKSDEILFMNEHMKKDFGRDYTGQICWEKFRNSTEPCSHCKINKLIDKNGHPLDVVVWQEQNPVTGKWYNHYARAIKWIDNRYVKLQIATDISQFRKMETLVRQSQKMEAIGTLAGGIAHDFNNILGAIVGFTELAQISKDDEQARQRHLDAVLKASNRATALVDQILTFSRQTEKENRPVRIDLIVKEVKKLLRASLPKTIEIKLTINTQARVYTDPTQIHQIVMNLCTNAGHAMKKKGGILDICLDEVELKANVVKLNPEVDPGRYIKLTISDTGEGIEKDILERIFDPFFTTKSKFEGTGMGLAVVHGIVKNYHGDILVRSEPKKGTTFDVYLPMVQTAEEFLQMEQSEAPSKGSERILFVDDEVMLVDIAKKALSSLGYTVTSVTNSAEALRLFQLRPYEYDIVITDMTMPHMTGDKLAAAIKKIKSDTPVILCTGFNSQITEKIAVESGFNALLIKPISRKEFSQTIRKVLDA